MAATRFHYEHNLELRITEHNLVPHEVAERESRSQAEGDDSLRDFFFGLKLSFRPLIISEEPQTGVATPDLIDKLKQAKRSMEQSKEGVQKALAEYEQAEGLYQRGSMRSCRGSKRPPRKPPQRSRRSFPSSNPLNRMRRFVSNPRCNF